MNDYKGLRIGSDVVSLVLLLPNALGFFVWFWFYHMVLTNFTDE